MRNLRGHSFRNQKWVSELCNIFARSVGIAVVYDRMMMMMMTTLPLALSWIIRLRSREWNEGNQYLLILNICVCVWYESKWRKRAAIRQKKLTISSDLTYERARSVGQWLASIIEVGTMHAKKRRVLTNNHEQLMTRVSQRNWDTKSLEKENGNKGGQFVKLISKTSQTVMKCKIVN